jgi:hypothetical protein
MSNALPIMNAPNPTTKWVLKLTKRVHRQLTRNNISRTVPPITRGPSQHPPPTATKATPVQRSPWLGKTAPCIHDASLPQTISKVCFAPIAGRLRNHNIISQQALNFLSNKVWNNSAPNHTPKNLWPKDTMTATNLEHLAMPMIHPMTGKTIMSYKKLMNNPVTMDTWKTAFGKDFGGMAQGNNKTGQQGTNSIFVMTHAEFLRIPANHTITYARVVVNFCPQKLDPHRIRPSKEMYVSSLYTTTNPMQSLLS